MYGSNASILDSMLQATPVKDQMFKNCFLYGLSDAEFNWYKHLTSALSNRGFVPSKIDPCVYDRHDLGNLCGRFRVSVQE